MKFCKKRQQDYQFRAVWKSGSCFVSYKHPGANMAADTLAFFSTSTATFVWYHSYHTSLRSSHSTPCKFKHVNLTNINKLYPQLKSTEMTKLTTKCHPLCTNDLTTCLVRKGSLYFMIWTFLHHSFVFGTKGYDHYGWKERKIQQGKLLQITIHYMYCHRSY
jgi:hypothetical protein